MQLACVMLRDIELVNGITPPSLLYFVFTVKQESLRRNWHY